jgi:hypothetical protein
MTEVGTHAPEIRGWLLPRERAVAKLRAGRPLLHDEPVVLDLDAAIDAFIRLAGARGLATRSLDVSALLSEAFVQHADHVRQLADRPGLEPGVIAEVAEHAVRPLRHAYADRLRPLARTLGDWQRGYCAICGSSPGRAGSVECGACGFRWQAAREEAAFRIELALADEDA